MRALPRKQSFRRQQKKGLKIIAIADHNEIDGVAPALTAAEDADILVVPAVELSTPEGHLLCYLPNYENLQRFHAQLDIVDRRTPNSRCRNAMLDCLNKLQPLGGFAMLAHVDAPGGFEVEVPGSSPHKVDVLCHRALFGIELKNAKSTVSYSDHGYGRWARPHRPGQEPPSRSWHVSIASHGF